MNDGLLFRFARLRMFVIRAIHFLMYCQYNGDSG